MSMGYGFREVLIDQQLPGKIQDCEVLSGGSQSTFQGRKFSDSAGGFSYKSSSSHRQIVQNRCIYWRTLNDTIEMTEVSLDYNLFDNQVRFIFRDSPIVGPITVKETDNHIVILVTTVASVTRIMFSHPKQFVEETDVKFMKNNHPSIFYQLTRKPLVSIKNQNIFDHSINIPVPTAAASFYSYPKGDSIFAIAYDSGSINICKLGADDSFSNYDLRQANLFSRLWSLTPSILKNQGPSDDSTIALKIFTAKIAKVTTIFVVTLTINGHLRLWKCNNGKTMNDWGVISDVLIDKMFAVNTFTDCNLMLRQAQNERIHGDYRDLPTFAVFIPSAGFRIYEIIEITQDPSQPFNTAPFNFNEVHSIEFKEKDLMDFTIANDFLFLLVSNSEEESEWELKSYKLNDVPNTRFNMALLEPLPYPDLEIFPALLDPKDFYFDLIFNKGPFSLGTINRALSMFTSFHRLAKFDSDWEQTKLYAINVIEAEIGIQTSTSDALLSDEDYHILSENIWHAFYASCVEYHINTVKPLGIFYDTNAKLLFIVKKERISFLRPTDYLETLFYFPHCVQLSKITDENDRSSHLGMVMNFLEILESIECTLLENQRNQIEKRLLERPSDIETVCEEVTMFLLEADPSVQYIERRHFIQNLTSRIKEMGEQAEMAMRYILNLLSNFESDHLNDPMDDGEDQRGVSEYFMGSRLGANITYKIFRQTLQHRFVIARSTVLFQDIIGTFKTLNLNTPIEDRRTALRALTHHFGLLKASERPSEILHDSVIEKGLKVATILNAHKADHTIQGKLVDSSPMKLYEAYFHSALGGQAIRSRVETFTRGSPVNAYAEAAGRSIWPLVNIDHPFEEFLIAYCQYGGLLNHAMDMGKLFHHSDLKLKQFYLGLVEICTGDCEKALRRFQRITIGDIGIDGYFPYKVLGIPLTMEFPNQQLSFFQKVISIFQIFNQTSGVQALSEYSLKFCNDDNSIAMMSTLAFKSALELCDYAAAYKFILKMPLEDEKGKERKEKLSALRTFVNRIIDCNDVEFLIQLDLTDPFSENVTMRDKVEEILEAKAKLANPLESLGIFQILFLYYTAHMDYQKAANSMYQRAIKLGEKGGGLAGLEAQNESYLDTLTSLTTYADPSMHFVIFTKVVNKEVVKEEIPYKDILKEFEVVSAHLRLSSIIPPEPIKLIDMKIKAELAVENLINAFFFDLGIKISTMWEFSYLPVIEVVATVCTSLLHEVKPKNGDLYDYIKRNDLSDIPYGNSNVYERAFRLLEKYLKDLEKDHDSSLHKAATMHFLSYNVELPIWLVESFKKRNTDQLIRCFMEYGEWRQATEIAVGVMEATLGRRDWRSFDPTIRELKPFESNPYLPFSTIDDLAYAIKEFAKTEDASLFDFWNQLKAVAGDYEVRFLETRREREAMFPIIPTASI